MKRNLFAIAIAALVCAPSFASDVTLYGIVDAALVKSSGQVTQMQSGGLSASRWGVRGTEDLGDGKSVVFGLEQGVDLTDGSTAGGFNRQSYVGLKGGFGTVTFGGVLSSMDDVIGLSNSGFDSLLSPSVGVLALNQDYKAGLNSAVKYVSPEFGGGFRAGLATTLKDAAGMQTSDLSLSYGVGPAQVHLSHQFQNDSIDKHLTGLNGSYDFGPAKLLASYGQVLQGDGKTDDYQLGVDVPLGAFVVSAGYARSEDNDVLGGDVRTGYGVSAAYSLSKRTTVYGGLRKSESDLLMTSFNTYAVGIRHAF